MPDPVFIYCNGPAPPRARQREAISLDWRRPSDTLNLDPELMDAFLSRDMPDRMRDLLEIAAYIYAADGMISRGGPVDTGVGGDWRRNIKFEIAVRDLSFWSDRAVGAHLAELLGLLSDDECEFAFVALEPALGTNGQARLAEWPALPADAVVLFSGGLDSLAGTLSLLEEGKKVLLVSHQSSPASGKAQRQLAREMKRIYKKTRLAHLQLPLTLKTGATKEDTHRMRSFLFATMAAIAAKSHQLDRAYFCENGVVSFNLPIAAAVIGTRATRTTHPAVMAQFSAFLARVLGSDFRFENPLIWKTKREVVGHIDAVRMAQLIAMTRSCAKVRAASKQKPHCGTCTQCLDRRFAILAAGLAEHDPEEAYAIDLLIGARPDGIDRAATQAFVETAVRCAELDPGGLIRSYPAVLRGLTPLGLPPDESLRRTCELHVRHGEAVVRVLREGMIEHQARIIPPTLDPSSLLALALRDKDSSAGIYPAAPPPQHSSTRDQWNVTVTVKAASKTVVSIEGLGSVEGKGALLLALLAEQYREDAAEGLRLEDYRLVPPAEIEVALSYQYNEALRRAVSRLRQRLQHMGQQKGFELGPETILDGGRGGYRLNPNNIRVVLGKKP
jgi:7-cyano-7-deazaguanine synthase in queuosine biosynthesis